MTANPDPSGDFLRQSRRAFLARTAAAAGAGVLITSPARAGRTRTLPRARPGAPLRAGDPLRIAVVGTGGMGTGHAQAIVSLTNQGRTDAHVVAIADVNQIRMGDALSWLERHQPGVGVDTYTDYREILARDDIHGIVIATPEHWHAQMAIEAMLAGKDVYIEKPMTLTLEEALQVREVQLANPDRLIQVGTQMIMLPKYISARRLIAEGRIGKPTISQTSYCRNSKQGEWLYYGIDGRWDPARNMDWPGWLGNKPPRSWDPALYARWRRYREFSTGIIGDLLVHVMTPLIMAVDAGWPTRIVAAGGHYVDKAMENHDTVNLTIQFEGEHTMIVAGSTANEVGLETLIRGHKANLYLGGRHCELRPERIYSDEIDPEVVESPDVGNDQHLLRLDWLECIRTREAPRSNVDLGTKVMIIVDLATRSMWDGGAWAFDPQTMRARRL